MKRAKRNLFCDLEVKDLHDDKGIVTFYFAAWSLDLKNEVILRTAYNKTFRENKDNIYHNRDHRDACGMPIEFGTDEKGAFCRSQLAMKTIVGRDTFEQYQAGLIKGHSQEFQVIIDEHDNETKIRTIKEVRLWGVTSVTTVPANLDTPTISLKTYQEAADILAKVNKLLTSGHISDELGERLMTEYKTLSETIKNHEKKIAEGKKGDGIDYGYLVENF